MTHSTPSPAAVLLPCPFCGSAPEVCTRMDEDLWTHNIVKWTKVSCGDCDVGFEWPPGIDAIEQWNKRTAPDTAVAAPWLPIDSAPKDGTKIWGWLYDSGIALMHWVTAEENAAADGSDEPDDYIACWVKSGEPEDGDWLPKFWKPYDGIGVPPGVTWTGRKWRDGTPPAPPTEG